MPTVALPGKKACNEAKTLCVTVDKKRGVAKVVVSKVIGATEVAAVAVRGTQEDGGSEVKGVVKKGSALLTVKLGGVASQGQVWVIRTPTTFLSSFQVG